MGETIKVGMADLKVAHAPDSLTTLGLGSCIGLTLYDPVAKVGGLVHFMLPDSTKLKNNTNIAKFGDTGIKELLRVVLAEGASQRRLVAKIAGGACMFEMSGLSAMGRVGERNAEAAKAMHKCLEVNEHSFGFPWSGGVNKDRCRQILAACADVGCQITIATDAHIAPHIGKFEETKKLLTEVGFPKELIASRDRQSFLSALKESGVKDLLTK